MANAASNITLTTGDIRSDYDVIGPVFAYGSSDQGILKTANPLEAYGKVSELLKQAGATAGGDGIVHAHFDYRVAVKSGCGGGQSFEVFAYGTAVKLRS